MHRRCALRSASSSSGYKTFFTAKLKRDEACEHKDALTWQLLSRVRIVRPTAFTAILMPSLFGPEVEWLRARGVPRHNMFAVERSRQTHAELVRRGMQTSPKPMLVQDALDYVPFDHVNLAYLDFFGQPNADHIGALRKLFRLYMRRGSTLWTTFGVNRGKTFACSLNRRLTAGCAGEAYVRAAHDMVEGAPPIKELVNYRYKSAELSHPANFILTEVRL